MTEKDVLAGCDGAQMSMNLCAEYHFIERDLQLNDEYRKLQKNLDGSATLVELNVIERVQS